jgi:hypothetical protein
MMPADASATSQGKAYKYNCWKNFPFQSFVVLLRLLQCSAWEATFIQMKSWTSAQPTVQCQVKTIFHHHLFITLLFPLPVKIPFLSFFLSYFSSFLLPPLLSIEVKIQEKLFIV